jgi:hypothetical protein
MAPSLPNEQGGSAAGPHSEAALETPSLTRTEDDLVVAPTPPIAFAAAPPVMARASPPTSIRYGTGYVVHALQFRFADGHPYGSVLTDGKYEVDPEDHVGLAARAPEFIMLQDEYIIGVEGFSSTMGFLAHSLTFQTTVRDFTITGHSAQHRGTFFSLRAPSGFFIHSIHCWKGNIAWARLEPREDAPRHYRPTWLYPRQ